MSQLARIFAINRKGLKLVGGAEMAGLLFVLWFVIVQTNQQQYFTTVVFAVLLVALSDPGGGYERRASRMAIFALLGGLVTGLGFLIGHEAAGFVVLAVFVFTLLAGLAVKFGLHAFAAGLLLNLWLLVVFSLATHVATNVATNAWHQTLAWLAGAATWIAFTFILWLVSRRKWQPAPVIDMQSSGSPVELTRPVVLFALLRAAALAASAAIAFGGHLSSADWMPIATMVAMKPSYEQSRLVGLQRLVGAALGAAVAIPFLILVHSRNALEAIIIVLAGIGAAIHGVNYAFYAAAIAAAALIAVDLPNPTNYTAEGKRVLFTFAGVGIGLVVIFIADRMQKHSAGATLKPA